MRWKFWVLILIMDAIGCFGLYILVSLLSLGVLNMFGSVLVGTVAVVWTSLFAYATYVYIRDDWMSWRKLGKSTKHTSGSYEYPTTAPSWDVDQKALQVRASMNGVNNIGHTIVVGEVVKD